MLLATLLLAVPTQTSNATLSDAEAAAAAAARVAEEHDFHSLLPLDELLAHLLVRTHSAHQEDRLDRHDVERVRELRG